MKSKRQAQILELIREQDIEKIVRSSPQVGKMLGTGFLKSISQSIQMCFEPLLAFRFFIFLVIL